MRSCCKALAIAFCLLPLADAQTFGGGHIASVESQPAIELKRGVTAVIPLKIRIRPRYHINAHEPAEEYLIPTVLQWDAPFDKAKEIRYPEAEILISEFSSEAVKVYSGTIGIDTLVDVPADFPPGATEIKGTLRYQACTNRACLPPRTLDLSVPAQVK